MLKANVLEALYSKYNKREYVHPDPLEFLYNYQNLKDREIVGLVASSLAYGRVSQILKDVSFVLDRMKSPYDFVINSDRESLSKAFDGFVHRYTNSDELIEFLLNLKNVLKKFGSLHDAFLSGMKSDDENIILALSNFIKLIMPDEKKNTLVPSPECKSPCKRLNLFLRWMVRHDDVDPDGWNDISPSRLIVPLDTHMYHISLALNLTSRRQADMRTACEITDGFRTISPEDPVKYDFCLTRLGIRDDTDINAFFKEYENA